MRILVIEPEPQDRSPLIAALTAAGHTVDEAATGAEAQQQWTEQTEVVVLSANLCDGDPYDLVRRFTSSSGRGRSAVIMTGYEAHPIMLERAKAAGASGWLLRPFAPEVLVDAVPGLPARASANDPARG